MEVNGLIFLLDIDVAKIKSTHEYVDEYYKISYPTSKDKDKYPYLVDEREHPHKRDVDYSKVLRATEKIATFIDIDTPYYDNRTILEDLGLETREQLAEFLGLLFDVNDLYVMIKEIDFYIAKVKGTFLSNAITMLDLEKEFPFVQLAHKINVEKEYKECMLYTYPMLCLQPTLEFSSGVIFPENVGKAYMDWSWREQELKRLYLTAKSKKDNFTERVYAKKNEEHTQNSKNKR